MFFPNSLGSARPAVGSGKALAVRSQKLKGQRPKNNCAQPDVSSFADNPDAPMSRFIAIFALHICARVLLCEGMRLSFFQSLPIFFVALLLGAAPVRAVQVRIASYNVLNGLDTASDRASYAVTRADDWWQVVDSIRRIDPDIVGFAELNNYDFDNLRALASLLGYPHVALSSEQMNVGDFRQGIMSKYPITGWDLVKENGTDPNAREIKRWPIHATIAVPGALNPLHVFVVHTHPGTDNKANRLWRAMNAWRMRRYLDDMKARLPEDVECVLMGDFNEDAYGAIGAGQHTSFDYAYYSERLAAGTLFGSWFRLGNDFLWSTNASAILPYKLYPSERFNDFSPVASTFRTGLENAADRTTYPFSSRTLDYILFSSEILQSPYGPPQCEVYWAANDAADNPPGLPKPGPWLDTLVLGSDLATAKSGLDHLMVFGDFHLIDAVPGLTPVAIISELAARPDAPSANFVEIANTGAYPLRVDGYTLDFHSRDNSVPAFSISLSGSIPAGGVWWAAPNAIVSSNRWADVLAGNGLDWHPPDVVEYRLGTSTFDGRGAVVLRNASGTILDVFGAVAVDGTGKLWDCAGKVAARSPAVTDPIDTWDAREWIFHPLPDRLDAATPGHHESGAAADVVVSAVSFSPAAPAIGEPFALTAVITPNALASNFVLTAHFSVNGDISSPAWTDGFPLENVSGNVWNAPAIDLAAAPGDAVSCRLQVSFDGPGGLSPAFSDQLDFAYPALADGRGRLDGLLFNEVSPAAGFAELAGPSGLSLEGWTLECWNIAEDAPALLWTRGFAAGATVPGTPAVADEWGNSVGFAVFSADPFETAAPAALVLRKPGGSVADAVAWLPPGAPAAPFAADFLPDTVLSVNVAQGLPNYLHLLGPAPASTAFSLQAPDWILTGRASDTPARVVRWDSAPPTPGALNAGQNSGDLALLRVDRDDDSLPDDEDNCPAAHNPTQADIDGDGLGNACDPDMDGDGIPNAIDNCPAVWNPEQEDSDGDGDGDACDPYFDPALLPASESFFVTFESVDPGALSFADGGRNWTFSSADVADAPSGFVLGARAALLEPGGILALDGVLTNGLASVAFFAAAPAEDGATGLVVETSADGETWDYLFHPVLSAALAPARFASSSPATNLHFRIRLDASAAGPVFLDNLRLVSFVRAVADADIVADLVVARDGAPHTNSFVVTPPFALWSVVYTNAEGDTVSAPVEIGVWGAILRVETTDAVAGGTFVFPGCLVIEPRVDPPVATAGIALPAATWAMLSGTVVPNRASALPVVFEYGTSPYNFGNKVLAEESPISGFDPVSVNATIEGLLPSTRYYWRIIAGDAATPAQTFDTDALPVVEPSVPVVASLDFLAQWPTLYGATNYLLSVCTLSGSSGETFTETFADWKAVPYPSIDDLNSGKSIYTEQRTAAGLWTATNCAVYPDNAATPPGSAGQLQLFTIVSKIAWLRAPPVDGITSVSWIASGNKYANSAIELQVSIDGGATFEVVTNITGMAATPVAATHDWDPPLPDGAIIRFAPAANRGVYLYDVSIATAPPTATPLPGYPVSVVPGEYAAACSALVSGLTPETTYHISVVAQGPGWETEPSPLVPVSTLPGGGMTPFPLPWPVAPSVTVGQTLATNVAAAGSPAPVASIGASDALGDASLVPDPAASSPAGTVALFTFTPVPADIGTRTFHFVATNRYGAVSNAFAVTVLPAPAVPGDFSIRHISTDPDTGAVTLSVEGLDPLFSYGLSATADLSDPAPGAWHPVARVPPSGTVILVPTSSPAFYRIEVLPAD